MDQATQKKTYRVGLVGHCGPDSSFLRMAVGSAVPGAKVLMLDNDADLQHALTDEEGVDLLLYNRVLEFGFHDRQGLELMKATLDKHPTVPAMMVSNFADAQELAEAAGARPGFGKNEIGRPKVSERIRAAVDRG